MSTSTTTDGQAGKFARFGRVAAAFALVIAGWLTVIVVLTFGSAPGTSMAIVGSPAQTVPVIAAAGGRILAANDYFTIARSDDAGFVARLYAAGARLVLDAEQAGGCSGLPPKRQIAKL